MENKILSLIIFSVIFMSALSFGAHANINCTNYANYSEAVGGNWTISNTTVCSDLKVSISGNISIMNGGSLTLHNSTITFNLTPTAVPKLEVFSGGTLRLNNTNITVNDTSYGFSFYYYSGSSGWINASQQSFSVIRYLYNISGSNGLFIGSSNVEIYNVTISDSRGPALNISSASPVVSNVLLQNNAGGGVYAISSSAALSNLTITNCTTGINASSSPLNVTNSTISLNTLYAIFLDASNAIVRNNTLSNNTAGVFANNSNTIIDKNVIRDSISNSTLAVGINISLTNSATITNNTLLNNTFGLVFWNANLTVGDMVINKSSYGVWLQNGSVVTIFNSIINDTLTNGRPNSSGIYFNTSSILSNLTIINVSYTNATFVGNTSSLGANASLTIKWYLDLYTCVNTTSVPVREVSVNITNGTSLWYSGISNINGTFPRINLTEAIIWQNYTNWATITANYSGYNFTGFKGNVTASNSTSLTANYVGSNNLSITLSLSMVALQVNGSGAATGYSVQNAAVAFTNGTYIFNATTSATGGLVTYIPIGYYNVSIMQANFSGTNSSYNSTILNISLGSNYSTILNATLFPRINISGNTSSTLYVANLYAITQDNSPIYSTINDTDHDVSAGAAMAYIGNATYAHNNAVVVGTIYVLSNATAPGNSNLASTSFKNLTLGGAFNIPFTAPSPSATTNYTDIVVSVNDSYGDKGTISEWLRVSVAASPDTSNQSGSGGSGGGGGGAGDYGLLVTEYDKQLIIAQGATKEVKVVVKNIGLKSLSKVSLSVTGISSSWYAVNISGGAGSTQDLAPDKSVTFIVKFTIPSTASAMAYKATWRVRDANAYTLTEKDLTLTVTQVWSSDRISALDAAITAVEKELVDLAKNISYFKAGGVDVSALEKNFAALNATMALVRSEFNSADYASALTDLNKVRADLPIVREALKKAKPTGVSQMLRTELAKPQGKIMLLAVIAVAVAGGLFLWWRFLRVNPIADIKKRPAAFEQGSRVQGVIKSITETKKGKVFLIADASGNRLHIRYPYYTTVEVGDMIRVSGAVKTYKDVPYMDATELHRVTAKPSG